MDEVDVTVVTPTMDSEETLARTLRSVRQQTGVHVEHVMVDGVSADATCQLARSSADAPDVVISEPDRGLYDAMNKGIALARGDYVAILNSDDRYARADVLSTAVGALRSSGREIAFSDLVYVDPSSDGADEPRVVRRYRSSRFRPERMAYGWMPAHPTMVVARSVYEEVGEFRTDYKIAADFEWCLRAFVTLGCSYEYLPMTSVVMALGGMSTSGWRATLQLNREVLRACRENDVDTNVAKIVSKYPAKLMDRIRPGRFS